MQNKPNLNESVKDSEIKSANYRILEKAFGKNEFEKGDDSSLKRLVREEILKEYPNLSEKPGAVEAISRYLAANFFEIVANLPKSPGKVMHHRIVNKFAKDSLDRYLASSEDSGKD